MRTRKVDTLRPPRLGNRTRQETQRVWSAELRKQMQRNLFLFLLADLQIAETFYNMAEASADDKYRRRRLLRLAQRAVDAVRRFNLRLMDEGSRGTIQARADRLSTCLTATDRQRRVA